MSTLRQLHEQGVQKVRLPEWNQWAYLELREVDGRLVVRLYDIGCPGRTVAMDDAEEIEAYEPYAPPVGYPEEYARSVYNWLDEINQYGEEK